MSEVRSTGKALNKQAILSINDCSRKEVFVPEWHGSVFLKSFNGHEREQFETCMIARRKKDSFNLVDLRAELLTLTLCDENGELLFSKEDVSALSKKSGAVLDRLFEEAGAMNGLSIAGAEEIRKNSESEPTGEHGSGSLDK